jgi:hypothetical protein
MNTHDKTAYIPESGEVGGASAHDEIKGIPGEGQKAKPGALLGAGVGRISRKLIEGKTAATSTRVSFADIEDVLTTLEKGEIRNISTELYREYTFPGGDKVKIEDPIVLILSESGGHRIVDTKLNGHYVPKGWIHLFWANKLGVLPIVA